MQHDTHKPTPISIVRNHVEAWRKSNNWSREALAQTIVETHEQLGLVAVTGIKFEPPTTDQFERQRVNADRVYRWLDDTSKDKNLLPFNFMWSILAAMPMERRQALADALLMPIGLGANEEQTEPHEDGDDVTIVMAHFTAVTTSAADAQLTMSKLLDGVHTGEPEAARAKLNRAASVFKRAIGAMGRLLRRKKKAPR